jgi:hypothetical protein
MAKRGRPRKNKESEETPSPSQQPKNSISSRLAESLEGYDEFLSDAVDEEFLDYAKRRAAKFEILELDLQSQIQLHSAELDYIGNIQARAEMALELAKAEENEAKAQMEVIKDQVRLDLKPEAQEKKWNMEDHKARVNVDVRVGQAREAYEIAIRRRIRANAAAMAIEADLRACKGREKMLQVMGMKWQFAEKEEQED